MMKSILQYSHHLLAKTLDSGDTAIDATCGNGHDTVFLCQAVGEKGHVYGFDIQDAAIANTKKRLRNKKLTNATIIKDSHSNFQHHVPVDRLTRLGGAIFNLGWLPGSDKSIITKADSTILALEGLLEHIKTGGMVVLVVYHGHPGGEEEKYHLMQYTRQLNQKHFNVLYYGFINQKNKPPFILAIQKKS
ncbi:MAG TPA: class I SAM-dependent methyltransferase [Bacillota bacterium]|nr:class I SAM-dependent methyltransferase [Bacillota bacterium]